MTDEKTYDTTITLSKDEELLLRGVINLAGKEGRSVATIMRYLDQRVGDDFQMLFAGYSNEIIENPPTAAEIRARLSGRQLTVNRRHNETIQLLLQWLMFQWEGTESLREYRDAYDSLNSKILDAGDELYEMGAYDDYKDGLDV